MTKEARQERRELWAERIEAFLSSGLSQRAWCREHGLRPNQLWILAAQV
ncbi:MAG: IS66 family insertion sequence element accessory protein TnpA [Limnochordia bacterium]